MGHLLDMVEFPPDDSDRIPDMCVTLLLAFSLHFELPDDNVVMRTLAERGTEKTFTEKLMVLFNRGGEGLSVFLVE